MVDGAYYQPEFFWVNFALWWGITDTEIDVSSAENPELSRVPSVIPGVGQSINLHALPIAGKCAFFISVFQVHATLKKKKKILFNKVCRKQGIMF